MARLSPVSYCAWQWLLLPSCASLHWHTLMLCHWCQCCGVVLVEVVDLLVLNKAVACLWVSKAYSSPAVWSLYQLELLSGWGTAVLSGLGPVCSLTAVGHEGQIERGTEKSLPSGFTAACLVQRQTITNVQLCNDIYVSVCYRECVCSCICLGGWPFAGAAAQCSTFRSMQWLQRST